MRLKYLLSVLLFFATGFVAANAAEESAIVAENKINVRGTPSLIGEVVTQLEQGEKVTVLERITNAPSSTAKPGEPTNWAKIKLPSNTPVWVFAPFVKDGVVNVSRLNVRGGRGEAYSVLGRLNRGDEVKVIRQVEEWMEIEAPTNAYAFVDLSLLQFGGEATPPAQPTVASQTPATTTPEQTQTPATAASTPTTAAATPDTVPQANQTETIAQIPATAPPSNNTDTAAVTTPQPAQPSNTTTNGPSAAPEVPSATATVATTTPTSPAIPTTTEAAPATSPETATIATPSTAAPTTNETPATVATSAPPAPTTSPLPEELPKVAPPVAKKTEPAPKRIVRREGIVRATTSIQAPTWYELVNPETKKRINYLFADGMDINLKDYRGQKVVVSGEEAIDSRWPNTPILDMQTLDVLPDESR